MKLSKKLRRVTIAASASLLMLSQAGCASLLALGIAGYGYDKLYLEPTMRNTRYIDPKAVRSVNLEIGGHTVALQVTLDGVIDNTSIFYKTPEGELIEIADYNEYSQDSIIDAVRIDSVCYSHPFDSDYYLLMRREGNLDLDRYDFKPAKEAGNKWFKFPKREFTEKTEEPYGWKLHDTHFDYVNAKDVFVFQQRFDHIISGLVDEGIIAEIAPKTASLLYNETK